MWLRQGRRLDEGCTLITGEATLNFVDRWWAALCWTPALLLAIRTIPKYYRSHRWRDAYMLMYCVVVITPIIVFNNTPAGTLLPIPLVVVGWAVAAILAVLTFRSFVIRSRQEREP